MSDISKITASRKAVREAAQLEWRAALAAEETADALEGIRQDLTLIAGHMLQVLHQLSTIANKPPGR